MKQLGYLEASGNILVECTQDELRAFQLLARVAQGRALHNYLGSNHERLDAEMSATLSTIIEWVEIADRANELRRIANEIDTAIKRDGARTEAGER